VDLPSGRFIWQPVQDTGVGHPAARGDPASRAGIPTPVVKLLSKMHTFLRMEHQRLRAFLA
jgi:hypothetical protein